MLKNNIQKQFFFLMFIFSSIFLLISIIYGSYLTHLDFLQNENSIFGQKFSTTEIPFSHFAKLTTWFYFAAIISWYSGTKCNIINLSKLPKVFFVPFLILFFVLLVIEFNIFWQFYYQISAMLVTSTIFPDADSFFYDLFNTGLQWNLNFAAKLFFVFIAIIFHCVYRIKDKL